MDNDFLFVTTAPRGRVESSVMHAFFDCMNSLPGQTRVALIEIDSLIPDANVLAAIRRARTVVVHSPLVSILPIAIVSRLAGAKVWAFVWDTYPVLIGGKRFDTRVKRRIADMVENIALKVCNRIFVPSSDFLREGKLAHATVLNLWPRFASDAIIGKPQRKTSDVLTFLFAGQVNATRGLGKTLDLLSAKTGGNFRLKIASHNELPDDIAEHPNVIALGSCSQSQLKKHYLDADFGLVSLIDEFDGPAFPSKTLEYVEQGLPVAYSGPPLKAYLDILHDSKTGLELQSTELIDQEMAVELRSGFHEKRERFMELACINKDDAIRKFLRLPNL